MADITLEERVDALETEVERLKQERRNGDVDAQPWWRQIWGTFKDDPDYVEAMRLGREYRQSLRPTDDTEDNA